MRSAILCVFVCWVVSSFEVLKLTPYDIVRMTATSSLTSPIGVGYPSVASFPHFEEEFNREDFTGTFVGVFFFFAFVVKVFLVPVDTFFEYSERIRSVPALREELLAYFQSLKMELVELLNRDYAGT